MKRKKIVAEAMAATHGIDDVLRKHRPPEEVVALQGEVDELKGRIREYRREHGQIEALIHQVLEATPAAPVLATQYRPAKDRPGSPVDCALHLSDIHYGATQSPDEVEGFGAYSPEIAERRLLNLCRDVLDWIEIKRGGYDVRRLHVLLTGDTVSGDIHEELRVTNAFPVPVQAVGVGALLVRCVAMLAPHFETVACHVVTDDNHGRLTRKPQAKEGGLNNWGYVVARWMQESLREHTNVRVNPITRPWDSVECNGRRYLLTHGHRVSGWAGFPYYGIERLVSREALKRMNAGDIRKFHKVVMGHWHAPLAHPWYWIGGSVSGTDAFDHGQGRHCEPKQVSWMIHPEHGEFDRTEWLLRDE
jgi:hypothetical protein